jgi:RecB family exonuclease
VVAGREGTSQLAPLLDEERRLFYVAITRARKNLVVTAVRGDEETPSRFLDELDPVAERPITNAPRALSLPAMVAELRSVATDPTQRRARRRSAAGQLARLAAEGVPGASPDEWWGLAALSDDRPLTDPGQRVPVSPSAVEKFERCELRWLLESVGARGGPATPQAIGNLIHDLAAWSAGPERPDPGDLAERLDELLGALDLGGPWAQRKERSRAHLMLGNFLGWLASHKRELVGAELPIKVPVGEKATLYGRVDRLERDSDGRFVVIDLKTGRSAPTKADIPRQPQLGAYQLAISEGGFANLVGDSAQPGGAALVQLGRGGQAKVQVQEPLSADEDPDWARRLVQTVADGMGGGQFLARPGSGCRTCPGRPSCPAVDDGRQVPGAE